MTPRHDPPAPEAREPRPPLPIVVLTVLLLAVLGGHFFVVWLYLTPTNPLKVALWGPVHGYMQPLFVQNWQLFAPTPIADDETMLVKTRWREQTTGRAWESDWMDITSPINHAIHTTRVGPYSKLARPYSTLQEMLTYSDPIAQASRDEALRTAFESWREAERLRPREDGKPRGLPDSTTLVLLDSLTRLTDMEEGQRRDGREMMYRLASAHANRMVGGRGEVLAINVRFATHQFPRFSDRRRPSEEGRTRYTRAFGWEKTRDDVALP